MTSSKQQFDKLFKQKMQALQFEPTDNAASKLLEDLKQKKKQVRTKTWGKLSMILIVMNTLVVLQLNFRYNQKPALYQARNNFENVNAFSFTSEPSFVASGEQHLIKEEQQYFILNELFETVHPGSNTQTTETWTMLSKMAAKNKAGLHIYHFKTAPPIAAIFEFEGDVLSEQKTSVSETLICGQNKEKTKLVIARSRIANFQADSLAKDKEKGICRPNGFDEDAVIQYNVYDKRTLFSRFQAEQIHWGMVRTTKIAKPEKQVEENKEPERKREPEKQVPEKQVSKKQDQEKQKKQKQNNYSAPVQRPQVHQHSIRQYDEPEYEEYDYFVKNDSLIFISEGVNFVVMMQPDGTILSKAQIEITQPYAYYLGEKRAFFDQQTGKTYMCVATLYHFNIYELEPANGQTKYLFQLDDVWPNPDFKVNNGKLSYTYKGNITERSL